MTHWALILFMFYKR